MVSVSGVSRKEGSSGEFAPLGLLAPLASALHLLLKSLAAEGFSHQVCSIKLHPSFPPFLDGLEIEEASSGAILTEALGCLGRLFAGSSGAALSSLAHLLVPAFGGLLAASADAPPLFKGRMPKVCPDTPGTKDSGRRDCRWRGR